MRVLVTSVAFFLFGFSTAHAIASDQTPFQKDHWYNDGVEIPVWQVTAKQKSHGSPVYQTSPHPDSPKMILTGNIIVHFPVDWTKQQVTDFINGYKTNEGTRLPLGKNIYRFQSETVSGSLALANAVYQSGKVIASYPDWMVATATPNLTAPVGRDKTR